MNERKCEKTYGSVTFDTPSSLNVLKYILFRIALWMAKVWEFLGILNFHNDDVEWT